MSISPHPVTASLLTPATTSIMSSVKVMQIWLRAKNPIVTLGTSAYRPAVMS